MVRSVDVSMRLGVHDSIRCQKCARGRLLAACELGRVIRAPDSQAPKALLGNGRRQTKHDIPSKQGCVLAMVKVQFYEGDFFEYERIVWWKFGSVKSFAQRLAIEKCHLPEWERHRVSYSPGVKKLGDRPNDNGQASGGQVAEWDSSCPQWRRHRERLLLAVSGPLTLKLTRISCIPRKPESTLLQKIPGAI